MVVSQNLNKKRLSVIFAPSQNYTPRPTITWGQASNLNDFYDFLDDQWNNKGSCAHGEKNVYSLTCDEDLGFGVFFMKGYGDHQTILYGYSCDSITNKWNSTVKDEWSKGYMITSCAARDTIFYLIMTKGANEYPENTGQILFIRDFWIDVKDEISEQWHEENRIITGICYNQGLQQYLVVTVSYTHLTLPTIYSV